MAFGLAAGAGSAGSAALSAAAPGAAAGAGGLGGLLGAGGGGGGGLADILKQINFSVQGKDFSASFNDPARRERQELIKRLFSILQGPRSLGAPGGGLNTVQVGGQNDVRATDAETAIGREGMGNFMGGGGLNLNQPIGDLSRFFRA